KSFRSDSTRRRSSQMTRRDAVGSDVMEEEHLSEQNTPLESITNDSVLWFPTTRRRVYVVPSSVAVNLVFLIVLVLFNLVVME
ncbi:hypothetical protein J6590_045041, partial [Homalodisca vitripennis]